jgi:hypothetical protein
MENSRLTSCERFLLAVSGIASLAAMGMLQCASLSVDNTVRGVLTLIAASLSVLCVSILLEDIAARPLHIALRSVLGRRASAH